MCLNEEIFKKAGHLSLTYSIIDIDNTLKRCKLADILTGEHPDFIVHLRNRSYFVLLQPEDNLLGHLQDAYSHLISELL